MNISIFNNITGKPPLTGSLDGVANLIRSNESQLVFETPCLEHELVALYFRVPKDGDNGMFMTSAKAIQTVGSGISQKLNPTQVGLVFYELGFQRVRYHGIRGYLVIQRSAEEMQAYQKGIILHDNTAEEDCRSEGGQPVCDISSDGSPTFRWQPGNLATLFYKPLRAGRKRYKSIYK